MQSTAEIQQSEAPIEASKPVVKEEEKLELGEMLELSAVDWTWPRE